MADALRSGGDRCFLVAPIFLSADTGDFDLCLCNALAREALDRMVAQEESEEVLLLVLLVVIREAMDTLMSSMLAASAETHSSCPEMLESFDGGVRMSVP